MSIPDKVAAAKKINEFLTAVVTHGGLRLKYRIIVDPPLPENRDWEKPEILVDFSGPDAALLLVRRTGAPYEFSPMSSRERRIVHLALRDEADLRTESEGEGMRRCLVVYPKDYKSAAKSAPRIRS